MRFFFYGTLLDRDVMALVLGRRLPPQAYAAAQLPRHARWRARGASYPIVVRDPKRVVPGAVVRGLSARDVAQLAAYEGEGYRIAPLAVRCAGSLLPVSVFEPVVEGGNGAYLDRRLQPSRQLWHLTQWQRLHKRGFVARVARVFNGRPAYSRQ